MEGKKGQDGVFQTPTLSPEPDTTLVIEHKVLLLRIINVAIIIFFGLRNTDQLSPSFLLLIRKRWFNCTINIF